MKEEIKLLEKAIDLAIRESNLFSRADIRAIDHSIELVKTLPDKISMLEEQIKKTEKPPRNPVKGRKGDS